MLLGVLVHDLGEFVGGFLQLGHGRFDGRRILALESLLRLLQGRFHRLALLFRQLVAVFGQRLLGRVDQLVGFVALVDTLATRLVGLGVGLGVLLHLLDLVRRQTAGCLDADRLLLVGALVLGRHVEDAVGVDVEGDLDLRHTPRRRGNAIEMKPTQRAVVVGKLAVALQHVYFHTRLVVGRSAEDLALLCRNRRVALDQLRHHPTHRLDSQRQRRHVQQQHVVDVAGQHAGLDGRAQGHHLVGIDPAMRLSAEHRLHRLLHLRHTRRAAHENHLVDLGRTQTRIFQRLLTGTLGALHQILHQLLELRPAQIHLHVLGTGLVRRDEGQVDLRAPRARQLTLGLLRRFFQPLQGHGVLAQVDAFGAFKFLSDPVDDTLVEIVTPKMGVTVRRLHLEDTVTQLQDADIEGATAEIVDGDLLRRILLVQTVGQGRRCRLVDDTQHLQTGDLTGVLRRLTLRVVEIRRHRDHRLRHLFPQIILRRLLHLLQHHGRDLRRRQLLAVDLGHRQIATPRLHRVRHLRHLLGHLVETTAHESLDAEHRIRRIRHRLTLRRLAHQPLTVLGEAHHRRRRTTPLRVADHLWLAALHHRHARIRRTQIDADYLAHSSLLPTPFHRSQLVDRNQLVDRSQPSPH